jgi:hypothetical protein
MFRTGHVPSSTSIQFTTQLSVLYSSQYSNLPYKRKMSTQTVHSNHIFHGLPQFPDHVQGLTAIITGANGISGQYMLKVLTQSPKRWARIYCLSRRPPVVEGKLPDFVKHIPLDFLDEPNVIAKTLLDKSVKA